jgi:hypothetical protein
MSRIFKIVKLPISSHQLFMKPPRLASILVGVAALTACSLQAPAPQPRRPEVEACDRSCKTLGGEEGFRCLDRCSAAGISEADSHQA